MHGTVLAMMAAAKGWGMAGTAPRSIQIISVRILSHAHQPQLVKTPRTRRRQDVLALRHHDALSLKVGNCAAQYRRLHVVDLGFELSA